MAKSVLVVDDEPNMVLSLEFLMKDAGFEVRTAGDGAEALKAIEDRPPDLVLLDVVMPGRDGYDVCQTVRANAAWNGVRIIILSAKGRLVDIQKGKELGADAYLTKPFSTTDLTDRVAAVLQDGGN